MASYSNLNTHENQKIPHSRSDRPPSSCTYYLFTVSDSSLLFNRRPTNGTTDFRNFTSTLPPKRNALILRPWSLSYDLDRSSSHIWSQDEPSCEMSSRWKFIVLTHRHTHTADRLPYLHHKVVGKVQISLTDANRLYRRRVSTTQSPTKSGWVRSGFRQVCWLCLDAGLSVQYRHVRILSVRLVGLQTKSVCDSVHWNLIWTGLVGDLVAGVA